MKKLLYFSTIFLLVGCVSYGSLRSENRKNLQNVKIGDSVSLVVAKMGDKSVGEVTNPYKRESIKSGNVDYDVWYYYTEFITDYWEKGVTPVVFVDGKVEAIGWRAMEKLGLDSNSSLTIRNR